jgi:hypothetical protein
MSGYIPEKCIGLKYHKMELLFPLGLIKYEHIKLSKKMGHAVAQLVQAPCPRAWVRFLMVSLKWLWG